MEQWVWDKLVQCKLDMMTAWDRYASLASKIGCEKAYIHCSMAECGKQWDDLFEGIPKREEIVSTHIPEERYENLQKLCAKLRHQVRSQNQTAYEVLEVLQGRINRQDTTLDYIHTTLQKEVVMLREQLFRARHPFSDSEFKAEEFCLVDFVNFADNTLKDTAEAVAKALQSKLGDTTTQENSMLTSLELRARDAEWKQKVDKMKGQHEAELSTVMKQLEAAKTQLAQKQTTYTVTMAQKDHQLTLLNKKISALETATAGMVLLGGGGGGGEGNDAASAKGSSTADDAAPLQEDKKEDPPAGGRQSIISQGSGRRATLTTGLDVKRVSIALESISRSQSLAESHAAALEAAKAASEAASRRESEGSTDDRVADLLSAHRKEVATVEGIYKIKLQNLVMQWESALKDYEAKAERDFKDLLVKNEGLYRKSEALQAEVATLTKQLAMAETRAEIRVRQQHAAALDDINKISKRLREERDELAVKVKALTAELEGVTASNVKSEELEAKVAELEQACAELESSAAAKDAQLEATLAEALEDARAAKEGASETHQQEVDDLRAQLAQQATEADTAATHGVVLQEDAARVSLAHQASVELSFTIARADPAMAPHLGGKADAEGAALAVSRALLSRRVLELSTGGQGGKGTGRKKGSRRVKDKDKDKDKDIKDKEKGRGSPPPAIKPVQSSQAGLRRRLRSTSVRKENAAISKHDSMGSGGLAKKASASQASAGRSGPPGSELSGSARLTAPVEGVQVESEGDDDDDDDDDDGSGSTGSDGSGGGPLLVRGDVAGALGVHSTDPTSPNVFSPISPLTEMGVSVGPDPLAHPAPPHVAFPPDLPDAHREIERLAHYLSAATAELAALHNQPGFLAIPVATSYDAETVAETDDDLTAVAVVEEVRPTDGAQQVSRNTQTPLSWWRRVMGIPHPALSGPGATLPPVYPATSGMSGGPVSAASLTPEQGWWQVSAKPDWHHDSPQPLVGQGTPGPLSVHTLTLNAEGATPRAPGGADAKKGRSPLPPRHGGGGGGALGEGIDAAAGVEAVDVRPVTAYDFHKAPVSQRGREPRGRSAGGAMRVPAPPAGATPRGATLQTVFEATPDGAAVQALDGAAFAADACVVYTSFPTLGGPRPPATAPRNRPHSGARPGALKHHWEAVAIPANRESYGASCQLAFDDLPSYPGPTVQRAPATSYLTGLRLSEKKRRRFNSKPRNGGDWEEYVETRVVDADIFRRSPRKASTASPAARRAREEIDALT